MRMLMSMIFCVFLSVTGALAAQETSGFAPQDFKPPISQPTESGLFIQSTENSNPTQTDNFSQTNEISQVDELSQMDDEISFTETFVGQEDEVYCDVVVVGGGSAGVPAAIQASRAGAKTILLESGFQLGGTATSGGVNFPGLFHADGQQVIAGIGWEWVEKTVALDHGTLPDFSIPVGPAHWNHQIRVNIPLYAAVGEELCLEAGVELRFYETPYKIVRRVPANAADTASDFVSSQLDDTQPVDAQPDDSGSAESCVTSREKSSAHWLLFTASPGMSRKIYCRELVDCTGNGTICQMLGAVRLREEDTQPGTFQFTIETGWDLAQLNPQEFEQSVQTALQEGRLLESDLRGDHLTWLKNLSTGSNNYLFHADNSTGELRTQTNRRGRKMALRVLRFLQSLPGGESVRLTSLSPEAGVRETYRIEGEYVITVDDYRSGRVWDDSMAFAFYPVDLHRNQTGVQPDPLVEGVVPTIPLRALIPKNMDHLLVAGRCISSDRLANSGLRVQASCMAQGQVAGAAAALAAKTNQSPRQLSLDELKSLLKKYGAIVPPLTENAVHAP